MSNKKARKQMARGNYRDKHEIRRANQQPVFFCPAGTIHAQPIVQLPLWLTILLLGTYLHEVHAAMEANDFPAEGSYQDQKKYVESLPRTCSEKIMGVATNVENANNPMQVSPAEIPEGVTYEVWRHSLFASDGIATKRHRVISKKQPEQQTRSALTDAVEIFIGGDNGKAPVLHHFKLNAETGDWTPAGKEEKSLAEYANGLEKSDVYVYRVSDESEECYSYRQAPGK